MKIVRRKSGVSLRQAYVFLGKEWGRASLSPHGAAPSIGFQPDIHRRVGLKPDLQNTVKIVRRKLGVSLRQAYVFLGKEWDRASRSPDGAAP